MSVNTTVSRAKLFASYESALTDLANIPHQLDQDLAGAQAVYDSAISTAAASAMDEEQRLARLRQSIITRFSSSAQSLRDANVVVPHQVRAVAGQKGDPRSLTAAINTQYEAERAVELELQAAAHAAKLQAAGDEPPFPAGQEAAKALRRRRERIRNEREETRREAERIRVEKEELLRQRRKLMVASGVGLLILLAVVTALLF